jgi:hypothetical protein
MEQFLIESHRTVLFQEYMPAQAPGIVPYKPAHSPVYQSSKTQSDHLFVGFPRGTIDDD